MPKKTLEFTNDDPSGDKKTVERLLKEKNRKLETDNMQLKVALTEKDNSLNSLKEELRKSEDTVAELRQLVLKLEEDIAKANNSPNTAPTNLENILSEVFGQLHPIICAKS